MERNETNEVEEPSFRGEIESEMGEEEEEEEDETRWKWWWDRDEGDKTRRGCVTGRNVPGRSRRFRDRPEALRFARIEGRRGGGTPASFGTCIFFGHGRKTPTCLGRKCLSGGRAAVARETLARAWISRGASKRALRMSGPVEKSDV